MYGPHVNALNVYVKTGNNLGSTVWSKAGTQGNQWNPAWVTLHARSHFKVTNFVFIGSFPLIACFIYYLQCINQRRFQIPDWLKFFK